MEFSAEDGKKLKEIFKILNFSDSEIIEHMDSIGQMLLMDVVAEAISRGENSFDDKIRNKDDVAKFLLENYSEQEIKEITALVLHDVIAQYFVKLLHEVDDDKKAEVEKLFAEIG